MAWYTEQVGVHANDGQVWDRLELKLLDCHDSVHKPNNRVSLSIQHPDLTSALMPPHGTPIAAFESISYRINFSSKHAGARGRRPKRPRNGEKACSDQRPDPSDADDEELIPADQRAVDDFLVNLNLGPSTATTAKKRRQHPGSGDILLHSTVTRDLINAYVESSMFGIKRWPKHVAISKENLAPPLRRLMPGVFDVPYLKVIPFAAMA